MVLWRGLSPARPRHMPKPSMNYTAVTFLSKAALCFLTTTRDSCLCLPLPATRRCPKNITYSLERCGAPPKIHDQCRARHRSAVIRISLPRPEHDRTCAAGLRGSDKLRTPHAFDLLRQAWRPRLRVLDCSIAPATAGTASPRRSPVRVLHRILPPAERVPTAHVRFHADRGKIFPTDRDATVRHAGQTYFQRFCSPAVCASAKTCQRQLARVHLVVACFAESMTIWIAHPRTGKRCFSLTRTSPFCNGAKETRLPSRGMNWRGAKPEPRRICHAASCT